MSAREEVLQRLELLKHAYRVQLPARFDEIDRDWKEAKTSAQPSAALTRLLEHAHKVAGTAGVFGLIAISRAAADLEAAAERQAGIDNSEQAYIADIACHVERLRALVAEVP